MKKKLIALFLTIGFLCFSYPLQAKNLWDKYLHRMEKFTPPATNFDLLLEILENRHSLDSKNQEDLHTLLKYGLEDENPLIRTSSALYIAQNKVSGFSKNIVEQIKQVKDLSEKKIYIWSFGEVGLAEDVLALVQYFQEEENPYLLNLLTAAMGKVSQKDGSITPLLLLAENSRQFYVKATAILGLGKAGDVRATPILWDLAFHNPAKEIRFCAILSLSTVLKAKGDFLEELLALKNRFNQVESQYEKLALAFTIQKLVGFDDGYYQYMASFLKTPYFSEVSLDLLENLPFTQGKDRLEIVVINYPQSQFKKRIQNLILKLKTEVPYDSFKRSCQNS